MKITFSPGIFSIWSQLVKCAKNSFHFMKMTHYRSMCSYYPEALFDLHLNMHLAISHESVKYWLIQCYKCTIHCIAIHLHCRKPMKYFWEKFHYTKLLGMSMNTGHMTTQFGLRPFFATNAAKVLVAHFFSLQRKKVLSWTKRVSWVFIVWLAFNRLVLANHPAPIFATISGRVILSRSSRYGWYPVVGCIFPKKYSNGLDFLFDNWNLEK